jgi:hypothetical protein
MDRESERLRTSALEVEVDEDAGRMVLIRPRDPQANPVAEDREGTVDHRDLRIEATWLTTGNPMDPVG